MNNQELIAIIYRAIVAINQENKGEDKVPSYVETAEKIASDVLLYLENNSNIR